MCSFISFLNPSSFRFFSKHKKNVRVVQLPWYHNKRASLEGLIDWFSFIFINLSAKAKSFGATIMQKLEKKYRKWYRRTTEHCQVSNLLKYQIVLTFYDKTRVVQVVKCHIGQTLPINWISLSDIYDLIIYDICSHTFISWKYI